MIYLLTVLTTFLLAETLNPEFQLVEKEVKQMNEMRESLVGSLSEPVTPETFKATCKPVGMRAKQVAKKNGWFFRQVSHKNRNPKNGPNPIESKALEEMSQNSKKTAFWRKDKAGHYYFHRITVQPKCLACHGPKERRPKFIKKKYPKDKAYGFKAGDLRGIYSVLVPSK